MRAGWHLHLVSDIQALSLSLTHTHTRALQHLTAQVAQDTYSLAACDSLIGSSVPRDNENDENFWIDRKLRRSREVVDIKIETTFVSLKSEYGLSQLNKLSRMFGRKKRIIT